jgi:hypothetical protein
MIALASLERCDAEVRSFLDAREQLRQQLRDALRDAVAEPLERLSGMLRRSRPPHGGQLLGVTVGLIRFAVWVVKRPDRERAPRRRRCGCTGCTGLPGRGHCGPSAPAPAMPISAARGSAVPPKAPARSISAQTPRLDALPFTAAQRPPYARVIDAPREFVFATTADFQAFMAEPASRLLSHRPCIRWIKPESAIIAPSHRVCAVCGAQLPHGETHAPRPPRRAILVPLPDGFNGMVTVEPAVEYHNSNLRLPGTDLPAGDSDN